MSESTALLHNYGVPPTTFIRWNGLADAGADDGGAETPAGSGAAQPARAGAWLHCQLQVHSAKPVDWNRCTELLGVVRPGHGLGEAAARACLLDAMQDHLRALDWPRVLVCRTTAYSGMHPHDRLVLDHPLTVFVALGKCIGTLWMRDRPWRLAAIQTPRVVQDSGSPFGIGRPPGAYWSCRLWFPEGPPAEILQRLRGVPAQGRQA